MSKVEMVIFDLDKTLAPSKTAIDTEMAQLLKTLLQNVKVAIISGGDYPQFQKQVIENLPSDSNFSNFYLCPTCATKFYTYEGEWKKLYSEDLGEENVKKISDAMQKAFELSGIKVEQTWGPQLEDRQTQVSFSVLRQQAPVEEKEKWDPDHSKKQAIKKYLDEMIPEFSIRLGGSTTIDITKPGVDKAYGIHKIKEVTNVELDNMLFIGDALFEGGNDYPVISTGVKCIQTSGPDNTKEILRELIDSGFDKSFNN